MPKKKLIFADTETSDGLDGCEFALGCWVTEKGKRAYTEKSQDEFCRQLLKPNFITYFHNLDFDGRFIVDYLVRNGIEFHVMKRGGRILCITVPLGDKAAEFRDSYALLPIALGKLPQIFNLGIEKLSLDNLEKRCQNDVLILRSALLSFFKYYPYAKGSVTIAQATFKEIKKKIPQSVFFTSDGETVNEPLEYAARKAYFGGRVEVFNLNYFEDVRHYDVNSMYPYVMMEYDYPIGVARAESLNYARENGFLYIAEAEVDIPYFYVPPLPTKAGKLYFAVGKVSGWFCSPELNYLIDTLGCAVHASKTYAFEGDKIFREFIREHYSKRLGLKESGNGLEKVEKLIMNSGYGKFAQHREFESWVFGTQAKEGWEMYSEEGIFCRSVKDYNPTKCINPAISCFITSYARVELLKLLHKVQPIYCDTDSIVTLDQLPESNCLGGLKLEHRGPFQAFGAKVYWEGGNAKAKGFQMAKAGFSSPEDLRKALTIGVQKRQYAKLFESMKRSGKPLSVKEMAKKIKSAYDKRRVKMDQDTEPWDMQEIEERLYAPKLAAAIEKQKRKEYAEWKNSDWYDPHLEDSALTEAEKYEEFKDKWKDYLYY